MRPKRAFTLVELLVVIAIIALLISILLPSLESAQEQARAVACAASFRNLTAADTLYGRQSRDWLPGSPAGSGAKLAATNVGDLGNDGNPIEGTDATNTPGIALQTWDWQTFVAFYGFGYEGLPKHRGKRWQMMRNLDAFRCKSNKFLGEAYANPWGGTDITPDWPVMIMNSYSTIREFMYLGWQQGLQENTGGHIPSWWGVRTPQSYKPTQTFIERPGGKVLLAEGSRFAPGSSSVPAPDFQIDYRHGPGPGLYGGAFSSAGPPSSYTRAYVNPIHLRSANDPKWDRYSYRHRKGSDPAMNVAYFDGHVETISKPEAITGVDLWYPRGTLVELDEFRVGPNPKPRAFEIMENRDDVQHPAGGLLKPIF